jgi:hypothetical protein
MFARGSSSVRMIAKRQQRRGVPIGAEQDVAARSTVSPVGPAFGYVCFSTERHRAGSTVTTAQIDLHLVDERGLAHPFRIRRLSALGSTQCATNGADGASLRAEVAEWKER